MHHHAQLFRDLSVKKILHYIHSKFLHNTLSQIKKIKTNIISQFLRVRSPVMAQPSSWDWGFLTEGGWSCLIWGLTWGHVSICSLMCGLAQPFTSYWNPLFLPIWALPCSCSKRQQALSRANYPGGKRQDRGHSAFYNLLSEVLHHYFCHSLLVPQSNQSLLAMPSRKKEISEPILEASFLSCAGRYSLPIL